MAVSTDLMTIEEVASHVRVHTTTVRRWIADGRLRAHRMGPRVTRIHRSDLRRFMAESKRIEQEASATNGALATRDGNSEAAASANSSAA